jgi:hypothetical protein
VSFEPVQDNVRSLRASASRDPGWTVEPHFTHFSSFRTPGALAAEL